MNDRILIVCFVLGVSIENNANSLSWVGNENWIHCVFLENLSAYICVNLRFDLIFLSSRPFVSIRGYRCFKSSRVLFHGASHAGDEIALEQKEHEHDRRH